MDLFAAATFFDDCPAYDAYTGQLLFYCQLSSFNDSNVVGSTSIRRVLSTGVGITIPTRRVLSLMGAPWIVGDGNDDSWEATAIRQSFNMKKASDLATVGSPAAMLSGTSSYQAYIQKSYFKDVYNTHETSDISTDWNIFLSRSEVIVSGQLLFDGDFYYRIREAYTPLEGIQVTRAYRFDDGMQTLSYVESVYSPATDSYVETATPLTTLTAPAALLYIRPMETAPQVQAGDLTIYMLTAPSIGSKVIHGSDTYRVLAYTSEVDAYLVHIRRA